MTTTQGWFLAESGQAERMAYRCCKCGVTVLLGPETTHVWCCGRQLPKPTLRIGLPSERFTAAPIMKLPFGYQADE